MARGQILVFVVFLMVMLLGAGLTFSHVFLRSLKVSDALADSIIAFHAADSGLEHGLYNERSGITQPMGCTSVGGACYQITRGESPLLIFLYSIGSYNDTFRSLSSFFNK